ncbi:MAG: hypothetical protein PWQ91_1661 [Eubacteriales bacterium]|nr:hypothetical protein [Eubacteriales bacterium]
MEITPLQREIIKILRECRASYAAPVSSLDLGRRLRVNPSYIREQAGLMQRQGLLEVRNGPGGGYFLSPRGWEVAKKIV